MKKIGIYKIENKINGKVYIGQSVNIGKRFIEHRYRAHDSTDEKTYGLYLYVAIRKYGVENFSFEIIEECDKELLNEREKYWISHFRSNQKEYGYNLSDGGDSKYTRNMNSETNMSIRKKHVKQIKDMLVNTDVPIKEIAKQFGMTIESITNINRGHSWHCTDCAYPLRDTRKKTYYYCPRCGTKLSGKNSKLCRKCDSEKKHHEQGHFIDKETFESDVNNYGLTELCKKYGVSTSTICRWAKKYNIKLKGWNQERRLKFEQVQQQDKDQDC